MSNGWIHSLKKSFSLDRDLHQLDHKMAKKYVKERLCAVYPELRNNPLALERAYSSLNLEPRPGVGRDEAPTVFELRMPEIFQD